MTMQLYALFQHSIEPLAIAEVGEALSETVPRLVRADAPQLVRRAFGVLVDRLSREEAEALRQALARRGLQVEIVEQNWLAMPPAVLCHRADLTPAGLVPYDLHGPTASVAWARILVLATGCYPRAQRVPVRSSSVDEAVRKLGRESTRFGKDWRDVTSSDRYEYREQDEVVLDMVTDIPSRHRIRIDQFDYSALGSRRQHSAWQNFPLLVSELIGRMPHAVHTQGIGQLSRTVRKVQRYPVELSFDREIAWTLWRYCGPGMGLDASAPYRSALPSTPRLTVPLLSRPGRAGAS